MNTPDFYYTLGSTGTASLTERGSKFIAYAFPIQEASECKARLDELKKEHPKASHLCFAYRIGLDGNTFRVSDAGEPSGTAGKPILGQLDSRQVTNALIVVVRYFGGTLLGVPGLINAYKNSASLVLQTTPVIQKPVEIAYTLEFDYTLLNDVMQLLKQQQTTIHHKEINLFCRLSISIQRARIQETLYHLNEMHGVTINPVQKINS